MANDDETAPWQIKAVRISQRQKCIRFAKMRGETVGAWVSRAIDTQASIETGDRVMPGRRPRKPGQPIPPKPSGIPITDLAALTQGLAALQASGGPVPKATVRSVCAVIHQDMRALRRQTEPADGQTDPAKGQTPLPIGQTFAALPDSRAVGSVPTDEPETADSDP